MTQQQTGSAFTVQQNSNKFIENKVRRNKQFTELKVEKLEND